jgi:hypothetical protein
MNLQEDTIQNLPKIEIGQVSSVYVGKPNSCMCGCSGKYSYTSINREWSGKNRGYKVDDEDINDMKVLRVIAKMKKHETEGIIQGVSYYDLTIGKTEYVIHMKEIGDVGA